ncbi:hypothetical protein F8M41_008209 [Gigaspora margarita]|uniref:Uncharacterized protein n=1 Tax=Gigaspora margarita TaxID=4874 RepID=A0A8H3X6I0_GIGMA|nr:hypothetical protein F8M41_008209 [Gigaspora margarita]
MDKFEVEGTVILKRYGVKDAEDPKKQAVLLGVASTIMPILLTKYPDLLAIDSTGCHNSLNFPNTAFMVRSNEPHADALKEWFTKNLNDQWLRDRVFYQFRFVKRSQDQEEFDQQKTTLLDAKKLQAATGIAKLAVAETIVSYFRKYWFGDWVDTWPDYKRDGCPMKTNMLLESYFKKDMILHYRGRYTKSLHSNLEKIATSMHVDSREVERFWRGEGKSPTTSKLQQEKKKDAWNVFRFCTNVDTQYIEMDEVSEKSFESENSDSIDECNKTLYVTHRSRKFACLCSFNIICGHECQDIVAVQLFIDKPELQNNFDSYNKSDKSAAESAVSCSFESYLHQKDANSHNKNELKLPEKRVKIVEIIGESRVIVNIIFENGSQDRCIVQLDDIIGYADEQIKKKSKVKITSSQPVPLSKDSYGNVVVYTMPYGGKKGMLYLTSTCSVDTSLTLIQSAFTYQDIYNQAAAFVLADPNSYTHLLLQVFDYQVDRFIWGLSEQKSQEPVVPESSYFESYLKHWQEPYNVPCSAEFKTINNEKLTNIPGNAFKIDKYKSVETGNVKYRLTGVSFCDGNHHIADVHFENVKNKEWYQYDGMGKSYRARAMYIGCSCPPHKDNYNMDYVIYVKI